MVAFYQLQEQVDPVKYMHACRQKVNQIFISDPSLGTPFYKSLMYVKSKIRYVRA